MPLNPEHGVEGGGKPAKSQEQKGVSISLEASHPHFSLEFQHRTFSHLCVFCVLE